MTRSLIALSLSVLLSTAPIYARAEPLKLELRTGFSPVPMQHQDKPGVWFPNSDAEYLLRLRTEIAPLLIDTLNKQDTIISTQHDQILSIQKTADLQLQKAATYEQLSVDYNKQLTVCLTKEVSFWRSPQTWTVIGFVSGVALTALVVSATK